MACRATWAGPWRRVAVTGIAASGWRVAALAAGLLAVPALLLIIAGRHHLVDESRFRAQRAGGVDLEILKVRPVWMCFAFFFLLTMAFGTFQNFGAPLMNGLYGMSVAGAAATLSVYLLGGAAGILVGEPDPVGPPGPHHQVLNWATGG